MKRNVPLEGSVFLTEPMTATVVLQKVGHEETIIRLDGRTILPGDTVSFTYPRDGIEIKFS